MLDKLVRLLAEMEVKKDEKEKELMNKSSHYGYGPEEEKKMKELQKEYPYQMNLYGILAMELHKDLEPHLDRMHACLQGLPDAVRPLAAANISAVIHLWAAELKEKSAKKAKLKDSEFSTDLN